MKMGKRKKVNLEKIIAAYDSRAGEFQVLEMKLTGGSENGCGVVAILSSTPGEGRSTVAVHLSRALARSGHKTLLIDGNPFNPALSELFGRVGDEGFRDLISAGSDIETGRINDLSREEEGGFFFLPWGGNAEIESPVGSPAGAFRSARQSGFESIVVDGPAAGEKPFGLILASSADKVLTVIASGRVPARVLSQFKERVDTTGTPMAGFVLNKFKF